MKRDPARRHSQSFRPETGRPVDLTIFGTVMLRLDVPHGATTTTYLFNPAVVDDLLRCPEEVARKVASILDSPVPVTTGAAGLIDAAQFERRA